MRLPALLLLAATILFASCQRELTDPSVQTTEQVVKIKTVRLQDTDPARSIDVTYAIQYDTPARKITFYRDDPATPGNLFDKPAQSFEYNSSGYLVKSFRLDLNDNLVPYFDVVRSPSNDIQKIIEHDIWGIGGDTVYMVYSRAGGMLTIIDSVNYPSIGYFQTSTIHYNSDLEPVSGKWAALGTEVLTYPFVRNAQGYSSISFDDTTDVVLDKVHHPIGWAQQREIFGGKDAFILRMSSISAFYNFLTSARGDNEEIFYDPLFDEIFSTMTVHGYVGARAYGLYRILRAVFTNTLDAEGRVATITMLAEDGHPVIYTFTYY